MVRPPITITGRIVITHIDEQTKKNPEYTFTSTQIAEELNVKRVNIGSILKGLTAHSNIIRISGTGKPGIAYIYRITKTGQTYAALIKKQEGIIPEVEGVL